MKSTTVYYPTSDLETLKTSRTSLTKVTGIINALKHTSKSTLLRITIAILYIALVHAAPFSSSPFSEFQYNYEANIAPDGGTGFRFTAKAHLELLMATEDGGQLVRLRLSQPNFYLSSSNTKPLNNEKHNPDHDLFAHIVTMQNGTAYIQQLYTHEADSTTLKNIKKSILLNLLPTNHHLNPLLITNEKDKLHATNINPTFIHDNNDAQPELFSPDSISRVTIVAKPRKGQASTNEITTTQSSSASAGRIVFESVEGYQNVTFRSRVFPQAGSNLTTSFKLELVEEINSKAHESYDNLDTIDSAIKLLNNKNKYHPDTIDLQREIKRCSNHHCPKNLLQLFQHYRDTLSNEYLATVEAPVAFLRILDRLRNSKGTSLTDIIEILKKTENDYGVQSSFLDILAAARTKDSISAALKYVRLAKNKDLDTAERFLSVLSVACKTASKMHLTRSLQSPFYFTPNFSLKRSMSAKAASSKMASLEFIAKELLNILKQTPSNKWKSHKLRWSTLLTLATVVNANNQEKHFSNTEDELNNEVSKLFLKEIVECPDTDADCRIVVLQAIGNVGNIGEEQFLVIKNQVLNSGRRESITAMRVLRDLLQNHSKQKPFSDTFYTNLKDLLWRVVYDNTQETTARVLASEMIVRFVPNDLVSMCLLRQLPLFDNSELATMIYSRMQSLKPDSLMKHHDWYWKSCIINGTSTSFVRTMARTESLNASYGVNVELLNKGKMPKESSFDVFLDTKERTQDLFSLGIFTRGLSSYAGGSDDGAEDENESTMAGMTLRLLGGYLRPYVFFTGNAELMSHVWRGTASEPTTAFNGNLLLIDHEEGYPLITGFVAEQQMRGVLSIDVTGKVKISFWHSNSHSVVKTRAAVLVQASQSVFTSYDNFFQSHLFSFGGEAMIDFIADLAFSSSPFKVCLQVTQPEFLIRFNSRRHEQAMTSDITRKLSRKIFPIGAKSYPLDKENNKMCSLMHENDEL